MLRSTVRLTALCLTAPALARDITSDKTLEVLGLLPDDLAAARALR